MTPTPHEALLDRAKDDVVLVRIPSNLRRRIDRAARKRKVKRSVWLRAAIVRELVMTEDL